MNLTDSEINALLNEPKSAEGDKVSYLRRWKPKEQFRECKIPLYSLVGEFVIHLRQSNINIMDFSAILTFTRNKKSINLKRYNGSSHEHSNSLEKERFHGFHIHTATERYIKRNPRKPESFAIETERYATVEEALDCLIADCNVTFKQPGLF
jgi:hypothetical protein